MAAMRIGEVARRSGVGVETIRYYEREGLLPEPERRPSGYRQYDGSTVERLEYIRRAKDLGFTLKEIGELLDLRVDRTRGCADVRALARAKIAVATTLNGSCAARLRTSAQALAADWSE